MKIYLSISISMYKQSLSLRYDNSYLAEVTPPDFIRWSDKKCDTILKFTINYRDLNNKRWIMLKHQCLIFCTIFRGRLRRYLLTYCFHSYVYFVPRNEITGHKKCSILIILLSFFFQLLCIKSQFNGYCRLGRFPIAYEDIQTSRR